MWLVLGVDRGSGRLLSENNSEGEIQRSTTESAKKLPCREHHLAMLQLGLWLRSIKGHEPSSSLRPSGSRSSSTRLSGLGWSPCVPSSSPLLTQHIRQALFGDVDASSNPILSLVTLPQKFQDKPCLAWSLFDSEKISSFFPFLES